MDKVLVIIPALNEEENIQRTVAAVSAQPIPCDILVVDDGSSDHTADLARQAGADVISLPFNVGIGAAVSLGLAQAERCGYTAAIRVDADGQHDPSYMQCLLSEVRSGGVDLCVGSRFYGSANGYRSSVIRRLGIHFFSALISALTGQRVTDPTSGFCAFSAPAIRLLSSYYPSDYPEPEAIVIVQRAGLIFKEVPVTMNQRVAGLSSIRYFKTLYYMIKVTLAIVFNYLRPRKTVPERSGLCL